MTHSQRFDAVGAQKGTALHGVASRLKDLADHVEDVFDPNSPEVTGAMQRFEQGLALLSGAPKREQSGEESEEQSPKRARGSRKAKDDTPTNTAEGQGSVTG